MTRSLYPFRAGPRRAVEPVQVAAQAAAQAVAQPAGIIAPGGHRLGGEGELRLLSDPVHPAAPRLIKKLLAARDAEERTEEVRAALQACGFEAYVYGWVGATPAGERTFCMVDSLGKRQWLQRYLNLDHCEVDPRLEPLATGQPLRWDEDGLQQRVASAPRPARLQRMLDDLRASGLHSGLVFNADWSGSGGRRVVVSLMSARSGCAWMSGPVLGRALAFGLHMHEFHARSSTGLWGLDAGAPDFAQRVGMRLGAIENAVLRGVERGLCAEQIATRLGISAEAVELHRQALRQVQGAVSVLARAG
jgi:hypothetical protein